MTEQIKYNLICVDCGISFIAARAARCPRCKRERDNRLSAESKRRRENAKSKRCEQCGRVLPLTMYSVKRDGKKHEHCKECNGGAKYEPEGGRKRCRPMGYAPWQPSWGCGND